MPRTPWRWPFVTPIERTPKPKSPPRLLLANMISLLALLASLTFVKSFPGSFPDYYRVVLQEDGEARYATAPDDPNEVKFKVSEDLAKQAFELAAKLNHFE